jgi:hypothetical protein
MPQPISIAVGRAGTLLQVPDGLRVTFTGAEVDPSETTRLADMRLMISEALTQPAEGPSLPQMVDGKRRVAILAGDLSHPAPYSVALPALTKTLIDAGIRPARITVLVCPGDCGSLLGRAAIRRYGEEIAGDFELRPLCNPAALKSEDDAAFAGADLRIALQPAGLPNIHPELQKIEATLELKLGRRLRMDIAGARLHRGPGTLPTVQNMQSARSDVLLTSGGGDDWESSLEEALLSLSVENLPRTTVLAFGGRDGLGSALFTSNILESIDALERGTLARENEGGYTALRAFDRALQSTDKLILFSEGLAEHPDTEDLLEALESRPKAAEKILLCTEQPALWETLRQLKGEEYSLAINPLGWRGRL